jgi:hypothetical protein
MSITVSTKRRIFRLVKVLETAVTTLGAKAWGYSPVSQASSLVSGGENRQRPACLGNDTSM